MATGGQDFRKFAPAGEPPYLLGDGVDVWATLSTGAPSPRDWLLLETHPDAHTVHGDAIIVGDWKIYRRGPECVLDRQRRAQFFLCGAAAALTPAQFPLKQLSRGRKRMVSAARPRPRDHALHA
jgi:hypothetical protein